MDKPKKPQTSDEEPAAPAAPPPPAMPTRSPFRPLSHRRRQQQVPGPASAVERPNTSLVFDASPTTIAAAVTKTGGLPAGQAARLAWGQGSNAATAPPRAEGDADLEVDPTTPDAAA